MFKNLSLNVLLLGLLKINWNYIVTANPVKYVWTDTRNSLDCIFFEFIFINKSIKKTKTR